MGKEEQEIIEDEEFIDLFIVDEICSNCVHEWTCREENKIGKCNQCKLIINLRNDFIEFSELYKSLVNTCDFLEKKLTKYEFPQSYKFEDLKEDEPLWDSKCESWRFNIQTDNCKKGFYDTIADEWIDFEENRFFPLTKVAEVL